MHSPIRTACTSTLPLALALAVSACSTPTTETDVWKSQSYAAGPMKQIAVFAGRVTATDRHTLEDAFVAQLASYGVRATPSYSIFPESQVPPDPLAVQSTLQGQGYDGALVSTMKGVTEAVLVAPDADWEGGFYGAYWGPGAPVYAETDQFVKFETTVWNPSSGHMVWSAITQTENPRSNTDFAQSLTKEVVSSIAKAGLIPARQGAPVSVVLRTPAAL